MDTELIPIPTMMTDTALQRINLFIALITLVMAIYLVITMFRWAQRLHDGKTKLRPFFISVALAKLAVAIWSAMGIVQIIFFYMTQPWLTFPARILIMVAVVIQAWVTADYYEDD